MDFSHKQLSWCWRGTDEIRAEYLLLNLARYIMHAHAAIRHGPDLLNGCIFYIEVLVQILSITPDIPLQQFDTLHVQEDFVALDIVLI